MFDKTIVIDDLAELATVENDNGGVWKQLIVSGKKFDIEVKILSNESDAVQKYSREKMRELRKYITFAQGEVDASDEAWDDAMSDGVEDALVRFVGIRKMSTKSPLKYGDDDFPMEKTAENKNLYEALLRGMPDVKKFITAESAKRDNFLLVGKKN